MQVEMSWVEVDGAGWTGWKWMELGGAGSMV